MPRGRRGGGGGGAGFTWDVTDVAIDYVKKSIKDMPGNNGQRVLVAVRFVLLSYIVDFLYEIMQN